MTERRVCDSEHLREYPGCLEECGKDECDGEREDTALVKDIAGDLPDYGSTPGVNSPAGVNLNAQHDALCIRRYGFPSPITGKLIGKDKTLSDEEWKALHTSIHLELRMLEYGTPETP